MDQEEIFEKESPKIRRQESFAMKKETKMNPIGEAKRNTINQPPSKQPPKQNPPVKKMAPSNSNRNIP